MNYTIHNSDFVAWAKEYNGERFHAVLCDPPYGIAFMGKDWDDPGGPLAFQSQVGEWGTALLPLLYPGALVFMFGGTRTWHRLAVGMEDVGFELWDTMMWLHGQGFPKGQDVSKLIDKMNGDKRENLFQEKRAGKSKGTFGSYDGNNWVSAPGSELSTTWAGHKTPQLKPAWEPILCFRAPNGGKKYAELALEFGSGALNVDASRIESGADYHDLDVTQGGDHFSVGSEQKTRGTKFTPASGRYPANLALECTCGVTETIESTETCKADSDGDTPNYKNKVYGKGMGGVKWTGTRPVSLVIHTDSDCPAFMLDEQSGNRRGSRCENPVECDLSKASVYGNEVDWRAARGPRGFADSGGASRFFYCAKASRSEREAGLDGFGTREGQKYGSIRANRGNGYPEATPIRNNHPTVKPIKLNEWLAKLLLPPAHINARLLVPFAGVSSEMIGALSAGWSDVVGVEMNADYVNIGIQRIEHWRANARTV